MSEDVADRREGGPTDAALEPEDYAEALAHVEQALAKEQTQSSGQPGFAPPPPERRSDWPAELDDYSFFSRDPIVSVVQSAIELYFDQPQNAGDVVTEEPADDQRRGPDDEPAVTDRTLRNDQPTRDPDGRRLFDKFSVTDAGWIASAVAMGVRKLRKRRAFNVTPPPSVRLDGQARVILVGDWGSGLPRAQKVAAAMRGYVEQSLRAQQDVHVVHLGDVYYSGWDYEYQKRFLPYWPVQSGEAGKAGSWCINGNHDRIPVGMPIRHASEDLRFPAGQASLHLHNDDWQVFVLDTAWDDNGLEISAGEFRDGTLGQFRQKAIALSHHQFFSAYEPSDDCGKVLREKLGSTLEGNRIHAAFWGHEHRCVLYELSQHIKYGRLVGHGGVPVYMTHAEGEPYVPPAAYEDRRFIDKGLERWALFGFAVLDFAGPKLYVRYVDENGFTSKDETIE